MSTYRRKERDCFMDIDRKPRDRKVPIPQKKENKESLGLFKVTLRAVLPFVTL